MGLGSSSSFGPKNSDFGHRPDFGAHPPGFAFGHSCFWALAQIEILSSLSPFHLREDYSYSYVVQFAMLLCNLQCFCVFCNVVVRFAMLFVVAHFAMWLCNLQCFCVFLQCGCAICNVFGIRRPNSAYIVINTRNIEKNTTDYGCGR